MIDLDMIQPGAVVQLMSGSPVMTVRGFKPLAAAGGQKPPIKRTHATCVVWSNRLGFVEKDFAGAELRFPAPRPIAPTPDPLADVDDSPEDRDG